MDIRLGRGYTWRVLNHREGARARSGRSTQLAVLFFAALAGGFAACDAAPRSTTVDTSSTEASEVAAGASTAETHAPTLLLLVIDTLRADAVSAYGAVAGTTPNIDRLAQGGLLYRRAFAPAPWTLPSHATLFTGLRPDQHGVGVRGRMALGPEATTLAEALAAAGYQTVGFSENPLVGPDMGLSRGFARYRALGLVEAFTRAAADESEKPPELDVVEELASWLEKRRSPAPLFLFVNLFEPHNPYEAREQNPFVGDGFSAASIAHAAKTSEYLLPMCDEVPSAKELEVLRGLYLGDVARRPITGSISASTR